MMAGAGGAMRATGWRATAIRFQQFGEGGLYAVLSLPNFRLPHSRSLSLCAAARRTTPAASATGADSILVICGWWRSMELGRVGPMMMSAVAGASCGVHRQQIGKSADTPPPNRLDTHTVRHDPDTELNHLDRPPPNGGR